jgi:hypothetical protein
MALAQEDMVSGPDAVIVGLSGHMIVMVMIMSMVVVVMVVVMGMTMRMIVTAQGVVVRHGDSLARCHCKIASHAP